jgi:GNAT superfamily N-acetyltransferase
MTGPARRRINLSRLYPQRLRPDDMSEALTLLDASAAWLRNQGVQGQWPTSFTDPSPDDVPRDRPEELRRYAAAGQLWVFRDAEYDDAVVATVVVTHWPDLDFAHYWPCGHSGLFDARYLCRMTVAREVRGNGVGAAVVGFAEWLATCAGVSFLRLDCSKTNTRLHEHYQSLGFERVGTADLPHRLSGALFERPVSVRAELAGHVR